MEKRIGDIYKSLKGILFNYLRKHTGCEEDAFDILQESFVKLIRNIEKVRAGGEKSWLFAVARNLMIDKWRREKKVKYFADNTDVAVLSVEELSLQDEFVQQGMNDCLETQIQLLKPLDKDLILLKYMSGLKINAISAITGLSEANVKIRLHRSRGRLKKMVEESCDEWR